MSRALGLNTDRWHRALSDEKRLDLLREHGRDGLEMTFHLVAPAIAQPQSANQLTLTGSRQRHERLWDVLVFRA
jgi:hypothetical protein